jgi:hypothetical protein
VRRAFEFKTTPDLEIGSRTPPDVAVATASLNGTLAIGRLPGLAVSTGCKAGGVNVAQSRPSPQSRR